MLGRWGFWTLLCAFPPNYVYKRLSVCQARSAVEVNGEDSCDHCALRFQCRIQ